MSRRGAWFSAAAALAIALAFAALRGGFGAASPAAACAVWSDAFFTVGVFVGGTGLLAFVSADGLFDILRFGVGKALRVVLRRERRNAYPRTFFDYRMQKRGEAMTGLSAALIGALCVALGGAFLALSM